MHLGGVSDSTQPFFLSKQGPIGWQSLVDPQTGEFSIERYIYYLVNSSDHAEISALSWEVAVQKHIKEEIYAISLEV